MRILVLGTTLLLAAVPAQAGLSLSVRLPKIKGALAVSRLCGELFSVGGERAVRK